MKKSRSFYLFIIFLGGSLLSMFFLTAGLSISSSSSTIESTQNKLLNFNNLNDLPNGKPPQTSRSYELELKESYNPQEWRLSSRIKLNLGTTTAAELNTISDIEYYKDQILLALVNQHEIRSLNLETGHTSRFAGTATANSFTPNLQKTESAIAYPLSLAAISGSILVSSVYNSARIIEIGADGIARDYLGGTGENADLPLANSTGDKVHFEMPVGLNIVDGSLLVSDWEQNLTFRIYQSAVNNFNLSEIKPSLLNKNTSSASLNQKMLRNYEEKEFLLSPNFLKTVKLMTNGSEFNASDSCYLDGQGVAMVEKNNGSVVLVSDSAYSVINQPESSKNGQLQVPKIACFGDSIFVLSDNEIKKYSTVKEG